MSNGAVAAPPAADSGSSTAEVSARATRRVAWPLWVITVGTAPAMAVGLHGLSWMLPGLVFGARILSHRPTRFPLSSLPLVVLVCWIPLSATVIPPSGLPLFTYRWLLWVGCLAKFGVRITHLDLTEPRNLEAAIGPQTKIVFFESPANPNMRLVDIPAISAIARRHGALTVVDNTYCTPYLQRPIELGADYVLHSATKYLGGHGDLLAGAIVGPAETLTQVRFYGLKDMTGAVLSAQDAFLVLRGLKTLALRMDRHCANAQGVAEFLAAHPKVSVVHFPGLPGFPQFELARRQMAQAGGMIAFELKDGIEAGRRFMNALRLFTRAVSLGDAESLAQHPASMTHCFYTPEERAEHLIGEGLVRLSIGLEDLPDLLADLEQALRAA